VTNIPGKSEIYTHENITIENCPQPEGYRGPLYHFAQYAWVAHRLPKLLSFKPDVLLLTAGAAHAASLASLAAKGTKIVPISTCAIWPKYAPLKPTQKVTSALERKFLRRFASAAIMMSHDGLQQANEVFRGKNTPLKVFLPLYSPSQFASIPPAAFGRKPTRILFAGRIEENKGVFDLVEMAERIEREHPGSVVFDVCGDGSRLGELRERVAARGLDKIVLCHGFCGRAKMVEHLASASLVVVPTRTTFEEGFNMVCAEAILAGRPLVTSDVCPGTALCSRRRDRSPPGQRRRLRRSHHQLTQSRETFESKRAACARLAQQFYDPAHCWGAIVKDAISEIGTLRAPDPSSMIRT
jgi:glycosyltransferase involved in cell wall biosynthesis